MVLNDVLEAVHTWFDGIWKEYGHQIGVEVVENTDVAFRVFFESADKVAELMVTEPDFAPFRFVSFQIFRVDEQPVFCYYDSDASTIRDIIGQLDVGMKQII